MIIEKRFWVKESDGIKCALSYPDPRSTKGFHTRLGGELVEKLSVPYNFENEEVMSVITMLEDKSKSLKFSVYTDDEDGLVEVLRCETHKIANEVAKALGHCYGTVYVTKND